MARKNIFHDIIPPEKRSIRNLALPSDKEKKEIDKKEKEDLKVTAKDRVREKENEEVVRKVNLKTIPEKERVTEAPERTSGRNWGDKPRSGRKVWVITLICLIALASAIAFLISKATVTVTIKSFTITLDDDISATQNDKGLTYSSIALTDTGSLDVTSSTTKKVLSTAAGTVVIYNNQATSQKLIAGTRLETPGGLIYKTDAAVTIPARTGSGSKTTPGSVSVKVHAEAAGPKYNIGLNDFTLPAFKGDPRYQNIYGRSKTEMTGGAEGNVPVLSDADASTTRSSIEKTLGSKLLSEATAQVPADFVLFNSANVITYSDLPAETNGDKATIKEQGSFKGYIFKKSDLATYLGTLKDEPIKGDVPLTIDASNLTISNISEANDTLKFHAKGTIKVSYILDTETLKKDLEGKNKTEAIQVFEKYPAIDTAKISITPLWWIPENADKIEVKTNESN